jgi:hypothetical protein
VKRRLWWLAAIALLASCGVQPARVSGVGPAPTGISPSETLYFVDVHEHLRPQPRQTQRLGTISDALSLLLTGAGADPLHTEISYAGTTEVMVTTTASLIQLSLPLTVEDVTALGIDQIVCTTLGVHVQGGGSRGAKVQLIFVQPAPASDQQRTCPLISPAG